MTTLTRTRLQNATGIWFGPRTRAHKQEPEIIDAEVVDYNPATYDPDPYIFHPSKMSDADYRRLDDMCFDVLNNPEMCGDRSVSEVLNEINNAIAKRMGY